MGGISSMHRRHKYHIHNRSQNKINIRTFWRNRPKWEDKIKMDLKIMHEIVARIRLAHARIQLPARQI